MQVQGVSFTITCAVMSNPLILESDFTMYFNRNAVKPKLMFTSQPTIAESAAMLTVSQPNVSDSQGNYSCVATYRHPDETQTIVNATQHITINSESFTMQQAFEVLENTYSARII